ncbi:PREDICTED: PRUPE_2G036800 [Prunus dulcis]|uniref:PREDICTED: PRUPE_2G036800 n=1 Tax=Prunus dulcis TaxID=3755 RepID=A0A5E4FCR3_PRUDU|nr:PREDICTED: PRUPE_2G036800 [Prunus dulcis]
MVGKQNLFVLVWLEVDLTKPLKRCLILGDDPKETRIYISYEALFAICFYCSKKKGSGHVCLVKISNKNYLQVERLSNEPSFFPRDLVLDEEDRRNLQDDVIIVFPQPNTVEDIHKSENDEEVEEGNRQNTDEREVGWTVVSSQK